MWGDNSNNILTINLITNSKPESSVSSIEFLVNENRTELSVVYVTKLYYQTKIIHIFKVTLRLLESDFVNMEESPKTDFGC